MALLDGGFLMRFHLFAIILLAGLAAPAVAQRDPVDRRIERLEQEMRAVQRRVFPAGNQQILAPEIAPQQQAGPSSTATGNALSSLSARVDALEAQLAALTGQSEENANRLRQIEEALTRLRTDSNARLEAVERATRPEPAPAASPPARTAPADPEPSPAGDTPPAAATDPAQAAYNAGFRLWEQRNFVEAQQALEGAAAAHPNSRWASWASNLAGRAYLDEGKPATAARVLLANYQNNPRGERAADSLFFLGQALVQLNRRTEACRVYDELQQVYPNMRDWLRQRLPAARTAARCTA